MMNQKKSPGADLESKRPLFFLSGLSIALLMVIFVIQIRSDYTIPKTETVYKAVADPDPIPQTFPARPEKPKQIFENSNDKINPVDEIINDVKPILPTPTIKDDGPMEEIDDVPIFDDTPETISAFVIQKLAVPMPCADISEREAQMACLNKWVYNYINSNINLNRVQSAFGVEGRVIVYFVISEHGDVENVEIVRSAYQSLDEEVLRIISEMPRFRPAGQMGRKAKMSMTIPVTIKRQ